jgi:predicted Zn-dependent protease
MEDGGPLPEPALVDLRCDGQRLPQRHTNDKGAFTFRIGGEPSRGIADSRRQMPGPAVGASGSDRSYVSLTNCELEATLPGYTSSKIYLGRRSVFESADVGTLVLRRLERSQGSMVSANTALAPPEARKAFERAEKEWTGKRPDAAKAGRELEKAIAAYGDFAAAWEMLGRVKLAQKDAAGARAAFEKAAAADPQFVPPVLALALMAVEQQQMPEAVRRAGDAIKLMPSLAEAHYYTARAKMALGEMEGAESSVRAVLGSPEAARYPRTRFMMGNILAQKGDLQGAAEEFRLYLEAEPGSRAADVVRKTLAEWRSAGRIR